jgi:hypothetical protein
MRACTLARNPGFAAVSWAACLISAGEGAAGAVLVLTAIVVLYV